MMRISAARFGVRLSGMVISHRLKAKLRVLAPERVELIQMQSDAFEERPSDIERVEGAGVRFFGCQAKD